MLRAETMEEILSLAAEDRVRLAEQIMDSISSSAKPTLTAEQLAELDSRLQDIKDGKVNWMTWEDYKKELYGPL